MRFSCLIPRGGGLCMVGGGEFRLKKGGGGRGVSMDTTEEREEREMGGGGGKDFGFSLEGVKHRERARDTHPPSLPMSNELRTWIFDHGILRIMMRVTDCDKDGGGGCELVTYSLG